MSRISCTLLLALVAACASTVLASAQAAPSQTEVDNSTLASSSPVAYVYVSNILSNDHGGNQINGYSAAPDGSLTPIPGSPFPENISTMAVNGAWLFGVEGGTGITSGQIINSFSIASNGVLTLKNQDNVNDSGGAAVYVYLDHTGSSLYADYYNTNNDYLAYSIDQSTGGVTFLNLLAGGPSNNSPVSFVGNNQFAYSSSCYHFTPGIYGVQRASDGSLSYLNINPPFPTPPTGDFYCPWLAAADPTTHLAVAVQPFTGNWGVAGPYQLATYTVDSSGNLTTSSTYTNMPKVLVGGVTDYQMSPSGKYLAVGGTSGLQLFHFNGANPITHMTGLLTTNQVDQMFWDNANHLYAISRNAGQLYVFSVTSTGVKQAPGSPHAITAPQYIIVLPKT
jgi:hypothetical protein